MITEKQLIHEWKTFLPTITLEQYKELRKNHTNPMTRTLAKELLRRSKINASTESFPTSVKKANPVYDTAERDTLSNRHGCMGSI